MFLGRVLTKTDSMRVWANSSVAWASVRNRHMGSTGSVNSRSRGSGGHGVPFHMGSSSYDEVSLEVGLNAADPNPARRPPILRG